MSSCIFELNNLYFELMDKFGINFKLTTYTAQEKYKRLCIFVENEN